MSDTDAKPEDTKDDAEIIEGELVDDTTPVDENIRVASAPAPEPAPKKSFMARAGWILAFGLAAFIGGVWTAPKFDAGLVELGLKKAAPAPAAGAPSADVSALKTEITDLKAALDRQQEMLAQHEAALKAGDEARARLKGDISTLATREQPATGAATDPQEIAALQQKVTALSDDVSRLSSLAGSTDPAVKDLSGAIAIARAESDQLKGRLAALEKAMKTVESGAIEASPRGRLVLALGRLRDRALAGLPFGQDLAALRPDFATLPALDQQRIGADLALLEDKGTGIRSLNALIADYDAAATEAVKADDKASGNFLTGLFTMRRTDAGATGLDATLAKAERSLRGRDVAGALKLLEGVTGPAANALKGWLDGARNYVAVEAAFRRLTATVARDDTGTPAPMPTEPAPANTSSDGAAS